MRLGASEDPVERYLRSLARWAPPRDRMDLVDEARRHLYDAARQLQRSGMDRDAAQRAAINAFGPAWRIGLATRGVDVSFPRVVVPGPRAMAHRVRRSFSRRCRRQGKLVARFFKPTRRLF